MKQGMSATISIHTLPHYMLFLILSEGELGEVGLAHVAAVLECGVHGECRAEIMADVLAVGVLQVIPKERTVVGVNAVLDDCLGSLVGILIAEVSHALLSDDYLHAVLAVVEVCHHRHDCRQGATLLN